MSIDIVARNEDKFSGLIIENTFLSLVSIHFRTWDSATTTGQTPERCAWENMKPFFIVIRLLVSRNPLFPRVREKGAFQFLRGLKSSFSFPPYPPPIVTSFVSFLTNTFLPFSHCATTEIAQGDPPCAPNDQQSGVPVPPSLEL